MSNLELKVKKPSIFDKKVFKKFSTGIKKVVVKVAIYFLNRIFGYLQKNLRDIEDGAIKKIREMFAGFACVQKSKKEEK